MTSARVENLEFDTGQRDRSGKVRPGRPSDGPGTPQTSQCTGQDADQGSGNARWDTCQTLHYAKMLTVFAGKSPTGKSRLIATGWSLIRLKPRAITLVQLYIFLKLITAVLATIALSHLLDADDGTLAIRTPLIALTTVGAVLYPFSLLHYLPKLRRDIKPIPMTIF